MRLHRMSALFVGLWYNPGYLYEGLFGIHSTRPFVAWIFFPNYWLDIMTDFYDLSTSIRTPIFCAWEFSAVQFLTFLSCCFWASSLIGLSYSSHFWLGFFTPKSGDTSVMIPLPTPLDNATFSLSKVVFAQMTHKIPCRPFLNNPQSAEW